MIWMYHDTHDIARIAAFSWSVIGYVVPSLILFALLPILLIRWHLPFYIALVIASLATIAGFFLMKSIFKMFGVTF